MGTIHRFTTERINAGDKSNYIEDRLINANKDLLRDWVRHIIDENTFIFTGIIKSSHESFDWGLIDTKCIVNMTSVSDEGHFNHFIKTEDEGVKAWLNIFESVYGKIDDTESESATGRRLDGKKVADKLNDLSSEIGLFESVITTLEDRPEMTGACATAEGLISCREAELSKLKNKDVDVTSIIKLKPSPYINESKEVDTCYCKNAQCIYYKGGFCMGRAFDCEDRQP
jgi:hypothetical protein